MRNRPSPRRWKWGNLRRSLLGSVFGLSLLLTFASFAEESPAWPDAKDLTPESLARCFADFKFELGDKLQDSKVFLDRKKGDCDDFAKLVSEILGRHGYTTRLVVVMMERQTHVVCYVKEVKGYLDYNLRAAAKPLVLSGESLEEIADKVAASFASQWHMASEIKYQADTPVYVSNTFPSPRPRAASPARVSSTPATKPLRDATLTASRQ